MSALSTEGQAAAMTMNREDFAELHATFPAISGAPVYIYALMDPESLECRYIGKSIRPLERLQNHMNERSNCHRSHWLQSLKRRGLMPLMTLLARIDGAWPWQAEERYWIARGRALGWPLTNNTDGGDGVDGLNPESRARVTAAWKGRKHKPETIVKLRAAMALRGPHSAATRAKMSASHKGRKITWIAKIAEANSKISATQEIEIRARLAAGELGRALAAEFGVHRTTMSKIKLGTYRR